MHVFAASIVSTLVRFRPKACSHNPEPKRQRNGYMYYDADDEAMAEVTIRSNYRNRLVYRNSRVEISSAKLILLKARESAKTRNAIIVIIQDVLQNNGSNVFVRIMILVIFTKNIFHKM